MKQRKTRRTKRLKSRLKISVSSIDPGGKPPMSAAKAQQLVKKIQAIHARLGVVELENCGELCPQYVRAIQDALAVKCKYACLWFYSTGGGWRLECYFRCSGDGFRIEGSVS